LPSVLTDGKEKSKTGLSRIFDKTKFIDVAKAKDFPPLVVR